MLLKVLASGGASAPLFLISSAIGIRVDAFRASVNHVTDGPFAAACAQIDGAASPTVFAIAGAVVALITAVELTDRLRRRTR